MEDSAGKEGRVTMYQLLIIVGNLGRDPEMRYTPSGQAVTNFSVATSRKYTDGSGQQVQETTWFQVSAWGKAAEACNTYLKKGSKVLVEGRLTPDPKTGGPRIWQGAEGPGTSYQVTANTVRFLSSRGEGEGDHEPRSSNAGGGYVPEEGDIPF
jgi:single-strand DNA-binding protein